MYLLPGMSDQQNSSADNGADAVDALPINKAGNTTYIVAGVAVLVLLGLILSMGSDEKKTSAEDIAKRAQPEGMTKAELEERKRNLKNLQAGIIAAAADDAEDEKEEKAAAKSAPAPSPSPRAKGGGPRPKSSAPKQKPPAGSLDFGADIASALE